MQKRTLTNPTGFEKRLGLPTKQELIKSYWIDSIPIGQIAQEYQVEPETIMEWIIKYDIPIRGFFEAIQLEYSYFGGFPASTQKIIEHTIPFNCLSTEVILHFPTGCIGLVEFSLIDDQGTQLMPRYGNPIALDDATERFQYIQFFEAGFKLRAKFSNYDSSYAHDVSCIVTIQRLTERNPKG